MTKDEARQLLDYTRWADALFFQLAEGLAEERVTAAAAGSFPSIAGTLGHIVGAEWVWLRRWLGESPSAMPTWVVAPTVADLKEKLAEVERERASFLAGLSDADLDRVVSYRTLSGQAYSDPLGHLVRHVVNHSTYHRGQLVAQLRQLGQVPPSTDLITYIRDSK